MNRTYRHPQFAAGLQRLRTRRRTRPQPKAGVMNKAEAQFAAYLSGCAEVVSWKYEPMSFWLAEKLRYTPDFLVEYQNGVLECVDVKAAWKDGKPHAEDDSLAKLKMFAQEYGDWFVVKIVWFDRATKAWHQRVFEPVDRSGAGGAG